MSACILTGMSRIRRPLLGADLPIALMYDLQMQLPQALPQLTSKPRFHRLILADVHDNIALHAHGAHFSSAMQSTVCHGMIGMAGCVLQQ